MGKISLYLYLRLIPCRRIILSSRLGVKLRRNEWIVKRWAQISLSAQRESLQRTTKENFSNYLSFLRYLKKVDKNSRFLTNPIIRRHFLPAHHYFLSKVRYEQNLNAAAIKVWPSHQIMSKSLIASHTYN